MRRKFELTSQAKDADKERQQQNREHSKTSSDADAVDSAYESTTIASFDAAASSPLPEGFSEHRLYVWGLENRFIAGEKENADTFFKFKESLSSGRSC
ncbi:hypothetical protein Csa_016772 [Cucumis sativus]|uniref:Uncharacterized protein n=1 Tax=Cucumis sativus TaxID=3659 RepID=A0A0A0K7S6_CUCSA|nr:hypothetical protein Csa_016772 [Cucumis sativus]